jgi:hypothetical protein
VIITKKNVKKFVRDAVISFLFWTGALTPYMWLVVRIDLSQYLAWISMQALIMPPLGAISAILFRWIDKKQ